MVIVVTDTKSNDHYQNTISEGKTNTKLKILETLIYYADSQPTISDQAFTLPFLVPSSS